MMNIHKWITYKPCTDCIIATCKLGLWEIKGPYDITTSKKIEAAYKKARDAGKYLNLPKEKSNDNPIKLK